MNYNSKITTQKRTSSKWFIPLLALLTLVSANAQQISKKKSPKSEVKDSKIKTSAYLFTYFTGNSVRKKQFDLL